VNASPLEPVLDAIEGAAPLDTVAGPIGRAARSLATGTPGEVLSGTWLGHPVHPLLTDVVVGSFTSASLLDLLGADGAAASALITVGAAAYAPTALTGITDWAASEATNPAVRRTGLVHAAANGIGTGLYLASLRPRARGQRMKGTLLGLAGLTVMSAGAYLGGHLTYALGVGADQTVFDPGPEDWTAVAGVGELSAGQPRRVIAGDTPVLLVRHEHGVHAIHDRCSHRGCSLAEGELDGETIVCGCHNSRFALRDGAVIDGPATSPQPAYETREQDDRIELRLQPRH
jgi:nitrite reductase/ring-hydroxylating ferredoxin subunit/uncharacterized membrane protein